MSLSPLEILLILVVALVLFGAKKLPEVGKALGSFVKEFRKASQDITESITLEDQGPNKKNESNKLNS